MRISKTYPMPGFRLIPIFLLTTFCLKAQQLSLFTQYRENMTIINPAAIESDFLGYGRNLSIGASYRVQWAGLSGAPRTQTLRASYLNSNASGVALMGGGYLINDKTGPTGFTGFYGRIGGVVTGDPYDGGLAIAISGGYVQYRVNASEIRLRDPNDFLGTVDQSQFFPDVGIGLYYYKTVGRNDNYFYTGLSVPQVFGLDLTFQNDQGEFYTQRVQHFYGLLGMYLFVGDDGSFIEPSLWVKYAPNAPTNVDLNIRYQLPTNLWIGTGVSSAGNFHIDAGVLVGGGYSDASFRIGYGYDYSFSSFGPTTGSTHEINLTLALDR